MPHRIIAVVLLLIFHIFSSASADSSKEQISKPLLICYERDPWLMVIGSDSPVFALYENGAVIYRSGVQDPTKRFLNAHLSPESTKQFLATLDLSKRLIEFDRKMIQASTVSDQPTNEVLYWVNGEFHAVGIYGQLGGAGSVRKDVPDSVLQIWDTVTAFKAPEAKPWLPPYIEVMIWPYEYSPEEPKAWPADWPTLNHPMTKKRGDSYSLYLDSKHFAEFLEFSRTRGQRQAVLIASKKWALSYRIPFPGEY